MNRQVAIGALEGDQVHAADLAYGKVVGIGLRRRAAGEVEVQIDVDRRPVRVEDAAHRLEDVNGARVEGYLGRGHDREFAAVVPYPERQRKAAAGDVRVDGDRLQVVDPGVDRRAVADRGGADIHRRIRAGHQAGRLRGLGPADQLLVHPCLVAHESDRIGHVAGVARRLDDEVVEAVELAQLGLHGGIVQGIVKPYVGIAFAAGEVAGLDAGVEGPALAIDDDHPRTLGDHRVALGVCVVAIDQRGKGAGKCAQALRRSGDQERIDQFVGFTVELVGDAQSPGFTRLRRADQIDYRLRRAAAVDRGYRNRHQAGGGRQAAAGNVGDEELAAACRRGKSGKRRARCQRGSIDLRGELGCDCLPGLAVIYSIREGKGIASNQQVQGPFGTGHRIAIEGDGRRIAIDQQDIDRGHAFLAVAVPAAHDIDRAGRAQCRIDLAPGREGDAEATGDDDAGTIGDRREAAAKVRVDGRGERRSDKLGRLDGVGVVIRADADFPRLADVRGAGQDDARRGGRHCRSGEAALGRQRRRRGDRERWAGRHGVGVHDHQAVADHARHEAGARRIDHGGKSGRDLGQRNGLAHLAAVGALDAAVGLLQHDIPDFASGGRPGQGQLLLCRLELRRATPYSAVGKADLEARRDLPAGRIDDEQLGRIRPGKVAGDRPETAHGVIVDRFRQLGADGGHGLATRHDLVTVREDRIGCRDQHVPGFTFDPGALLVEADHLAGRRHGVERDSGGRDHSEVRGDGASVRTRDDEDVAISEGGEACRRAGVDTGGEGGEDLGDRFGTGDDMAVDRAIRRDPEPDDPDLARDRGRAGRNACYRGRGLGQRIARGLRRSICRRGREGIREREDHHARAIGGGDEVGIGADGRGKGRRVLLERHHGQQGRAIDQDEVAAVRAGGELRSSECVQRPGQARHDIREVVPGKHRVAHLRHDPADIDTRRPDLAGRGYRRSGQRGTHDVAGRVDVGGQQGGDHLGRLDLVQIGGIRPEGHLPEVADASCPGQCEARRGRHCRLGDAARRRGDRERRAGRHGLGVNQDQRIAVHTGDETRSRRTQVDHCRQARGDLGKRHGLAHHMRVRAGAECHRHRLAGLRRAADRHGAATDRRGGSCRTIPGRDGEGGGIEDGKGIAAAGCSGPGVVDDLLRQCRDDFRQRLDPQAARRQVAIGVKLPDHMAECAGAGNHLPGFTFGRNALRHTDGRSRRLRGSGAGDCAHNRVGHRETQAGVCVLGRHGDRRTGPGSRESGQPVDRRLQIQGELIKTGDHLPRDGGRHAGDRQRHAPCIADDDGCEQYQVARAGDGLLDDGPGRRTAVQDEGLAGIGTLGRNGQDRAGGRGLVTRRGIDGGRQGRSQARQIAGDCRGRGRGHRDAARGQRHRPLVAGGHRALKIEAARYRDHRGRQHADLRREVHAGLVDDHQILAPGNCQEAVGRTRVDCGREALRDLFEGRQARPRCCRIAVDVDQGNNVADASETGRRRQFHAPCIADRDATRNRRGAARSGRGNRVVCIGKRAGAADRGECPTRSRNADAGAARGGEEPGEFVLLAQWILIPSVDVLGKLAGDPGQRCRVAIAADIRRQHGISGESRPDIERPDLASRRRAGKRDGRKRRGALRQGVVRRHRQRRCRHRRAGLRQHQHRALDRGRIADLGIGQRGKAGGNVAKAHARGHGERPGLRIEPEVPDLARDRRADELQLPCPVRRCRRIDAGHATIRHREAADGERQAILPDDEDLFADRNRAVGGTAVGVDQLGELRRNLRSRIDGAGHGDRRRVAIDRNAPGRIPERHARQREYRCRGRRGGDDDAARSGHGRGRVRQYAARGHDCDGALVGGDNGDEAGQKVQLEGQCSRELGEGPDRGHGPDTVAMGHGNRLRRV